MLESEINLTRSFQETLQHLSLHTQKAYQHDLATLLEYCKIQGVNKWRDLDGRQMRGYAAWRHRQGIGGKSLQRNLSAVRAFYRYLINQGVTGQNPTQGILAPKTP